MAFSGTEADFVQAHPEAQRVGKSVQVWLWQGREYMPLYKNSLSEDLAQRDLTINAFALDEEGHIFAHPFAFFDVKNGILRPASEQAFFQDPTRLYRLARFAATYPHFTVHKDALKQAQALVQEKKQEALPAERVGRELLKALQAPCPALFFHCLVQCHALHPWFSEMEICLGQAPQILVKWRQYGENAQEMYFSAYELALFRWMFLGALWPAHEGEEVHPMVHMGQRVCLPLAFAKAAVSMTTYGEKARILQNLPLAEQVHMMLTVHKQGLSKLFWAVIDALCPATLPSVYALQALQVLLQVHLPLEWQDRGAASGEKLLELQVQALAGC